MRRQTYNAKAGDVPRQWRIVDAEGQPLGRLAAEVAQVLMGKHRPEYTPHVDTGDYVIITNASKVALTGKKADHRFRRRWTGYPGGVTLESYGDLRERRPELLISDAVRRMLPKNRLGRHMLKKLKVYPGVEHPHDSSNPVPMGV
ncbi:MAG: 50S ribosomal protein L13 [Phycisphaerales bacterium]|jgi:large subunit ribosomal protein L13|nr:50S ribosomal protein L13 [Phycisphaerales bacterium]